jgi:hypothetical protein
MATQIYPVTLLDSNQVIQYVYDESTQALRTTALATIVGGDLTVDTSHTEDSMRLGDGTNFLTSTTVGADVGLDVNIINAELEVDLDHTEDSVRLGDGTNFLTSTTVGADVGLDTNIINNDPIQVTPIFSSKLRQRLQTATISITSAVTYDTIFTRTGSGLFIGFNLEFAANRAVVKLQIDDDIILDGVDIATLNGFVFTGATMDKRQNGQGAVTSASVYDFSMRYPIEYKTSITISARLSGGAALNFNQGVVYLTEET